MPSDIGSIKEFAGGKADTEEFIDENVQVELETIYTDFQKCLELRDKYMKLSLQRLGDNPKDKDSWVIYPQPPKPTWEKPQSQYESHKRHNEKKTVGEDFKFEECNIPEEHDGKPAYVVPRSNEYFRDLDYILKVISEGPAKSYAYRRLRYLEGKWNMFVLLKEYQEVVDSKDEVIYRDNQVLTLTKVFESLKLTAYDLSIDTLDMHAHTDSFHRFDKFNLKYNPIGESRLREIFLKTDNYINGRYLAELTKGKLIDYRIDLFAKMIILDLFEPLFEVTKDPKTHPELHIFLQRVVGFDSVDDESKAERRIHKKYPHPKDWDTALNPPYSYYLYYI
ncbi:1344_t:CDS:2 [Racocetra fulgida]|uniref:AMP deaminase n=1 Tax=Racocetra fulgida TaxID=60492 RepID=A0A9N9FGI5_9GLOM|nr:1344_t:CDS:2 [Racocetra fulgida]